jgi:hypothetical protein
MAAKTDVVERRRSRCRPRGVFGYHEIRVASDPMVGGNPLLGKPNAEMENKVASKALRLGTRCWFAEKWKYLDKLWLSDLLKTVRR